MMDDPEMRRFFEEEGLLDRQSHELADQIRRAAKTDDKKDLETKLRATVERHFMLRQERREHELKRLEEQLDRLRQGVAERTQKKAELIQRRIDELVGNPKEVGF